MATIGELEKANTFLKYKLKYQTAEAEKAAKKVGHSRSTCPDQNLILYPGTRQDIKTARRNCAANEGMQRERIEPLKGILQMIVKWKREIIK